MQPDDEQPAGRRNLLEPELDVIECQDGRSVDLRAVAVVAAIDDAAEPVVVGHSAACTLAWMAADRRIGATSSVVLIGGLPASDGERYAEFFPLSDGVMPFPGWDPFEGPDAADLDESSRARISDGALPVPGAVATGVVTLTDERRFDVPVVMICPEYSVSQAEGWVRSGDVPELARATNVSYVDIDSGHWPMVTRPVELARLIDDATHQRSEPV